MSEELKFHPLTDLFPLIEGDEFDALVADINTNRLRDEIILYEGMILDGRNRYRALRTLGLDPEQIRDRLCVTKDCIDEHHGGPAAYVISANIHRRHLTTEQKRELITKLIKAAPEKSDRQIAAVAKVDHKTVGVARARVEGRGEIPHVEERTDTKGRKQPARKQPRARAKTNWKIDDERARAKTKRKIDDERKSLVRRLTEADRGIVVLLSSFFEKYPDQINAFVNDVWFSAAEIGPEASAQVMKTKFAAAELSTEKGGAT